MAEEDRLVGLTLGRYRILEKLTSGGMATIYRGYHPGLDRHVAVKVLPEYFAHRPQLVERFRREAKAVARLDHPNIVPVYDFGEEQGIPYIVMKYVEGGTLKDLIARGALPLNQSLLLVGQVAQALAYAHRQGVIHRDVKPSNVLLTSPNWALLSDFGIAKLAEENVGGLTGSGVGVGTADYMAPEQAVEAAKVDGRADIYSLGVVLYQAVSGLLPYVSDTPMGVMIKHMHDPIPPVRYHAPDLPEAVEKIIYRAMAKSPAERFQKAEEMAGALAAVGGAPLPVDPQETTLPVEVAEPDEALFETLVDDLEVVEEVPNTIDTTSGLLGEAMKPEHRELFKTALAAYDVGSRDTARRLTLQILKEDERTPEAWLLLSYIEENWYDAMQCAENALAVAPDMQDAKLRVEQLKAQRLPATIGRAYSAIPAVKEAHDEAMNQYFQESQLERSVDGLDDPNQCPYCGVVNDLRRKTCSSCGKNLVRLRPVARERTGALRLTVMLNLGSLVMVGLQVFPVLLWGWYIRLPDKVFMDIVFAQDAAHVIAGPFTEILNPTLFIVLLVLAGIRAVVLFAVQLGLRWRLRLAYFIGLATFFFEALWALFVLVMQWTGPFIAVASALIGGMGVGMLFFAAENFPVIWERYRVQPDERLKSARAHWDKGREHQRDGMWALALAEYRAAVGAAPNRPEYYKSLAIGYNRLGYVDRALRALEQTQRLDPTDMEVAALIKRLRAQQAGTGGSGVIAPLQKEM